MRQHCFYMLFDRRDIFFPGASPASLCSDLRLVLNFVKRGVISQCILHDPLAHLHITIKILFPGQAFLALITLMRSAGRVSLWLRDLFHMEQCRNMCFPYFAQAIFKYFTHACVVPALYIVYIKTVGIFCFTEAFHSSADRAFGSLIFTRYGNTVNILPYKHCQRHLYNTCCVHGFPEMSLGRRCIADSSETYFVAIMG